MKFLAFFTSILLLFSACNNANTSNNTSNTEMNHTDSLSSDSLDICFQHVEGNRNQDTSYIHLILNQSEVKGQYNHMPYENDSRKGTLKAVKTGSEIKGVWIFSQEGMQDSLDVAFELQDSVLLQKPFSVDMSTGRQVLRDTSDYSIRYTKLKCK